MLNRSFIFLAGAAFSLLSACGNSADIEKNIRNSQKLTIGIMLDSALKIMGEPHEIREHANYRKVHVYFYESPPGASDWIYFSVDSTNRVIEIAPNETERK